MTNSKPSDGGGMPHSDEERERNVMKNDGEGCVSDAETVGQTEPEPTEEQEQEQQPNPELMNNPICIAEFLLPHLLTKLGAPMYAYDQFREWAKYIGRNKVDPYIIQTLLLHIN